MQRVGILTSSQELLRPDSIQDDYIPTHWTEDRTSRRVLTRQVLSEEKDINFSDSEDE